MTSAVHRHNIESVLVRRVAAWETLVRDSDMAKIWPVYDGSPSTTGEPWAVLPRDEAVRILDLAPEHFIRELARPPAFGSTERNMTMLGYRHIIVEISADEADGRWQAGFYRSPLSPPDAFFRIQLERKLGRDWRVELERGFDADGDPALWAWIALRADASAAAWGRENRERIETEVREAASESGLADWVFVRFRKDAELRAAS